MEELDTEYVTHERNQGKWHRHYVVTWQSITWWRHNGLDGISNHQPHHCLLNRLFGRRSKKTSKLRVTGLCAGNSPETGEFPAQKASNAEIVSIWWRHHGKFWHNCLYFVAIDLNKLLTKQSSCGIFGHHDRKRYYNESDSKVKPLRLCKTQTRRLCRGPMSISTIMNNLLKKKQSRCWWFETPWHLCDITLMRFGFRNLCFSGAPRLVNEYRTKYRVSID